MRTLIVGMGQVGRALYKVLEPHYLTCAWPDTSKWMRCSGIMHICFPYSEDFEGEVKSYQEKFLPKYTVIHSTVPVGTSRKLGAIHSPVRGLHPNLESGIRTFVKYLGGGQASEVADYFRRAGLRVYLTDKPETTELMKIWSTTWYAAEIEMTKQIKRDCDKNSVPFELWSLWAQSYNEGYGELGYPEYARPNLVPIMKPQGGHCTLGNLEFLDNWLTRILKGLNDG